MADKVMTSMERVLATLGHREPDRVPFVLPATMHPAREMGLSLRDYFSRAEYVAEGQLRTREKYGHDILMGFFYGPIELEAWGGEVIFREDGPPNSGRPFIGSPEDITRLKPPSVADSERLCEVLGAIRLLKAAAGNEVPIFGVVISPFSLPVMQMGFAQYFDLMLGGDRKLFDRLMESNIAFSVEWANAQLEAGATGIVYFDPVSSSLVITREQYLKTGFEVAKRAISSIKGPVATHFASGQCMPILDRVPETKTVVVGCSTNEDLADLKRACSGKITVLGNLNGVEMRRWDAETARREVKKALSKGGPGGGFILSDNHGEIPFQVPEEVLREISQTVHEWGRYPLDWAVEYDV